jgi:hypothetical protein
MSSADFRRFVDPSKVPRISKQQAKMSFDAYPPFLDRLLGMWGPLSKARMQGLTSDGRVQQGLFSLRSENAPVSAAAEAATRWLNALDPETRQNVQFPVDSDLWRQWHNTPLLLRTPPQVELLELNEVTRALALEVIRSSLSDTGYRNTRGVMANNLLLGELNGLTDLLNEWAFTLTIFGTPSSSKPWGWQLFGHHLSLNCLFIADQMVLSPVFMGVEPDIETGPGHRRMFLLHEQRALAVMNALTDAERARAVLYGSMLTADQPPGRFHPDDGRQVGGAFQDNRIVPYEGVPAEALDAAQRRLILDLAEVFINILPSGPAEARLRDIERHLDATHFAWIGKADEVNPFYFRIHSPVALIEFDHHSGIFLANEEPARFHVHTIVRTPNAGDYGFDLLRQHYAQGGHDRAEPEERGHHHHHGGSDHGHGAHSHDGGKTFHHHD